MPTPTIVQTKVSPDPSAVNVQTEDLQFTSVTVAGRSIVHFCMTSDFAGVHADIITRDTQSNTWTKLDQQNTNPSGGAATLCSFLASNIVGDSGTPDTVTEAFGTVGESEDFFAQFIMEIDGVGASPLVGHRGNTQNALAPGSNNVNSGAAIVVAANQVPCLMIAAAMNSSVGGTPNAPTVGTGMSLLTTIWQFIGFSTQKTTTIATRAITVAGSYQAIFNQASSATEDMACVALILQGASAAALFPPLPGLGITDQRNNTLLRMGGYRKHRGVMVPTWQ